MSHLDKTTLACYNTRLSEFKSEVASMSTISQPESTKLINNVEDNDLERVILLMNDISQLINKISSSPVSKDQYSQVV